jgi:hypothetical protein
MSAVEGGADIDHSLLQVSFWTQTRPALSHFGGTNTVPAVFFQSTADRVTSPEQVVLASDGVGSCLS